MGSLCKVTSNLGINYIFGCYRFTNYLINSEKNTQNNFIISPNPSQNFETVSYTKYNLTNKPYKITDATGKVVRNGFLETENPTISMEGFATGLYYLIIENTTVKLVKQ